MTVFIDSCTEEVDASEASIILKPQAAALPALETLKLESAVVALAALPDGRLSGRFTNYLDHRNSISTISRN